MNEEREPYVALMGEAVMAGMGPVEGVMFPHASPEQNIGVCAVRVHRQLLDIDWENRAMEPPRGRDTENKTYGEACQVYGEKLTSIAFQEAETLMYYAGRAIRRHWLPDGLNTGQLLLNSERTLLAPSRLDDGSKCNFFNALRQPTYSRSIIGVQLRYPVLEVRNDAKGQSLLDWTGPLPQWLREHVPAQGGCPAHREIITAGDRKMTLMHFFWDKLVRASYAIDKP